MRFRPYARPFHTHLLTCARCGESCFTHDTISGAELEAEVIALLGVRDDATVCRACADRAERELDDAADALALAVAA